MSEHSPTKRALSEAEIEQLRALVRDRAAQMSESDLRALLDQEHTLRAKVRSMGGALPRFRRHLEVSYGMVRDYWKGDYRQVPFWSVASLAAAIGYFLTPTDLMPDFIPMVGLLDDATVMAAVLAGIREDLKRYCTLKGIELEE